MFYHCVLVLYCKYIVLHSTVVYYIQALTSSSTVGSAFVPNDTYITPDKHIALITGANGSGKSVYLKQVGLLVFLAHIGSWIPCDKALIGITDKYVVDNRV